MGYGPPLVPDSPPAIVQVLATTAGIYWRALSMFLTVGILGALATNVLFVAWTPEAIDVLTLWVLLTQAPNVLAVAAATVIAWQLSHEQQPSIAVGYLTAFRFGVPYVTGGLLVGFVLVMIFFIPVVISPTLGPPIGVVLGLFLAARVCLFGPLLVIEGLPLGAAFRRSWRLVTGRTIHAIVLLFVTGLVTLLMIAAGRLLANGVGSAAADVLLLTITEGLTIPFLAVLVFVMFSEYRRLAGEEGPPPEASLEAPPEP